jgi:hypothetical protein
MPAAVGGGEPEGMASMVADEGWSTGVVTAFTSVDAASSESARKKN